MGMIQREQGIGARDEYIDSICSVTTELSSNSAERSPGQRLIQDPIKVNQEILLLYGNPRNIGQ